MFGFLPPAEESARLFKDEYDLLKLGHSRDTVLPDERSDTNGHDPFTAISQFVDRFWIEMVKVAEVSG